MTVVQLTFVDLPVAGWAGRRAPLTGHVRQTVRQQAEAAGCDRFLLKPCPPSVLAGEVRELLLHPHHHAADTHAS
jgi:CheY-like chemotaxis protein